MTNKMIDHHDAEIAPEIAALNLEDKPDGPGAAAMLAAGIGVLTLGLTIILAELSTGIHDFLENFQGSRGVGTLAGKSTVAMIVWLGSWAGLHYVWRDKDIDIKKMFNVGLVLGLIGALFTFPPFFELFK
jgi:hypothetical protein